MKTNNNHVVIATSINGAHKIETNKSSVAEMAFKHWRKKKMKVMWYFEAYLPEMRSVA